MECGRGKLRLKGGSRRRLRDDAARLEPEDLLE